MPVVVAEAAKRGYPIDRMAVSGGSAGGTLALLYAYRDAAESPVPVRMVFEMVGPPSFQPADWGIYGLDQSPEAAAALFSTMSGRDITPEIIGTQAYDDSIRCISAYMWVDSATVPTLCAYGVKDLSVPLGAPSDRCAGTQWSASPLHRVSTLWPRPSERQPPNGAIHVPIERISRQIHTRKIKRRQLGETLLWYDEIVVLTIKWRIGR